MLKMEMEDVLVQVEDQLNLLEDELIAYHMKEKTRYETLQGEMRKLQQIVDNAKQEVENQKQFQFFSVNFEMTKCRNNERWAASLVQDKIIFDDSNIEELKDELTLYDAIKIDIRKSNSMIFHKL
uniref:Coiled-coil domain containing 169 n=1 Tax=Loa loa TaxID=7209 RepID=A0A1I7VAI8_LOALO